MPIQFKCPQCQQLLQVPDGSEGRQAQCSHCQATLTVPAAAAADNNPFASTPGTSSQWDNPYAASEQSGTPLLKVGLPPIKHSTFNVREVIYSGYLITRKRFWPLVGGLLLIGLVYMVVACGVGAVAGLGALALGALAGGGFDPNGPTGATAVLMRGANIAVGLLVAPLVQCWMIGLILSIARGEPLAFERIFSASRHYGRMFVANLLFMLITQIPLQVGSLLIELKDPTLAAVGLGIILVWIIPMVILLIILALTLFFVVDREAGGVEALKLSVEFTRGNRLRIFLLYLCWFLIMIAVLLPSSIITAGAIFGATTAVDDILTVILVVVAIMGGVVTFVLMLVISLISLMTYNVMYFRITGQPTMLEEPDPQPPAPEVRSMGHTG